MNRFDKPGTPDTDSKTDSKADRLTRLRGAARWLFQPVLLLAVVALLLRLYRLEAQSLWLDEGNTWNMTRQGWGALLAELFSPVSAYPLYHLLLKGWVALAGESEWALRFPSALAGAAAVVALYAAAGELAPRSRGDPGGPQQSGWGAPFPLVAGLLLVASPFATWYAQEAKVYSFFLLVSALLLWALLRALRHATRRAWLLYGAVALVSLFVHRFALLLLVASLVAVLLAASWHGTLRRWRWLLLLLVLSVGAAVVWAMVQGVGGEAAAPRDHRGVGMTGALWLTFVRFSLNRGPGEAPWWWLLPWGALLAWGGVALLRNVLRPGEGEQRPARVALACFLLVPLALFLAQLAFTHLYAARYLMLIFPAWVLLLAYPVAGVRHLAPLAPRLLLVGAALLTSGGALLQPRLGLFSGAPVKEEYRQAVEVLARHAHPDDLIVLHPSYIAPLYDYYMQRFTSDPPPEPVLFDAFKKGQTEFGPREWHTARMTYFAGHLRSFLLIAPEHASIVDVPNPVYQDEYGLVGLYFQYSSKVEKWPCGIWRFVGAHLLCQESPETYVTGDVPRPATPVGAQFGENLHFLGYTLKETMPLVGGNSYRAGGVVPISLFWDVARPLERDYAMFVHLCRDCSLPPVASDDGPPLEGYLPTSVWLPNKPARDDRTIPLPRDLAPGRYTLLMGVYPLDDPMPEARLAVAARGEQVLAYNRLVLATIEVVAPSNQ